MPQNGAIHLLFAIHQRPQGFSLKKIRDIPRPFAGRAKGMNRRQTPPARRLGLLDLLENRDKLQIAIRVELVPRLAPAS